MEALVSKSSTRNFDCQSHRLVPFHPKWDVAIHVVIELPLLEIVFGENGSSCVVPAGDVSDGNSVGLVLCAPERLFDVCCPARSRFV